MAPVGSVVPALDLARPSVGGLAGLVGVGAAPLATGPLFPLSAKATASWSCDRSSEWLQSAGYLPSRHMRRLATYSACSTLADPPAATVHDYTMLDSGRRCTFGGWQRTQPSALLPHAQAARRNDYREPDSDHRCTFSDSRNTPLVPQPPCPQYAVAHDHKALDTCHPSRSAGCPHRSLPKPAHSAQEQSHQRSVTSKRVSWPALDFHRLSQTVGETIGVCHWK